MVAAVALFALLVALNRTPVRRSVVAAETFVDLFAGDRCRRDARRRHSRGHVFGEPRICFDFREIFAYQWPRAKAVSDGFSKKFSRNLGEN